jgi:hypothetical protein
MESMMDAIKPVFSSTRCPFLMYFKNNKLEGKSIEFSKNGIKVEYNFAMINRGNGFFEPVMNIQNVSQQNKVGLSTPPQDIYYISSRTRTDMDFANELREQIKSRNEKKKILEELQIFDSKIEDIIVDGINIEVYLKGVDKPLPIQALGAGSFTVLEMASIFGREKIKNIFIDEIEDGLHIQSMEIIAKYLSKTMEQKPDLQLFITCAPRHTMNPRLDLAIFHTRLVLW